MTKKRIYGPVCDWCKTPLIDTEKYLLVFDDKYICNTCILKRGLIYQHVTKGAGTLENKYSKPSWQYINDPASKSWFIKLGKTVLKWLVVGLLAGMLVCTAQRVYANMVAPTPLYSTYVDSVIPFLSKYYAKQKSITTVEYKLLGQKQVDNTFIYRLAVKAKGKFPTQINDAEKWVLLQTIDEAWKINLQTLDNLLEIANKDRLGKADFEARFKELLTFVKGHKLAPPDSDYYGADGEDWDDLKQFIPDAHLSTGIAIEHMVLAGTALGHFGVGPAGGYPAKASTELYLHQS